MALTGSTTKWTTVRKKKRYRLKKSVKRKLILWGVSALVLFILYFPVSAMINRFLDPPDVGNIDVSRYRDLNAVHLKHARAGGVAGFKTDKEFRAKAGELVDDDKLVKVRDNRYYVVEKLTHSHPYLTPDAADLLDEIGRKFKKRLDDKDLGRYYFQVTSLLRTQESQKKLSRSNGNASPTTSHLYGTTFDIAYSSVIKKPLPWRKSEVIHGPAIKALSEAIGELRKEGRCVVVTERNERCFHITAIKK